MLLNIEDMLKLFNGDLKVIAGKNGLSREVSTVTVIDAPDFYKWINGKEFIISTAYVIRDDIDYLLELLDIMNQKNAAGLGIKIDRYIKKIPEDIKNKADRLNFPIIYIPDEFAFADIINPVLSEVVNRQAKKLRYSEKVHESFTKLVLEDEDFPVILDNLEKLIKTKTVFYDKFSEQLFNSRELINNTKGISDLIEENFTYKLIYKNKTYGYIILIDKEADFVLKEYDKIAVEHAATVLRLKIQREISNYQVELRFRNEFIQDLIFNNFSSKDEIKEQLNKYDWKYNNDIFCLITKLDKHCSITKARDLERKFKKEFGGSVFTQIGNRFIYLIESDGSSEYMDRTVKDKIKKIFSDASNGSFFYTGIGNARDNIADINLSYEEAKNALNLGMNIKSEEKIYFFNELGIYRLLDIVIKEDIAEEFLEDNLGKLIRYDNSANDNLLETLETIIENDWNLKKSSQDLFIHYNTAKYRFSKICKILDLDPDDWNQKLNLAISVKLLKMNI
ncbi:PucR family transcriptional regulator ligand-binding domain-containing protein [Halanaerobium sp. MA284_MarDTE_T2]|uniref:PucR family transcriptional regulator n=1 Tax=Halanaerobium sp. MA284_MarDTE_T2 TaxID=2183913 RepID=UPI000DF26126|nr:PucR family transcriptional regulator ligand-binding domain-containing protein [Halanaerobium sp. MA284_MarDTE_T2]RCW47757.1 purine catabolism regulator [Halanaerobium sp. MA284_MarDTE_T2]